MFDFTNDRNLLATGVNQIVRNELDIAMASKNLQRTMMGMRTQQLTAMGAMQELNKTRTMLMQAGQTGKARRSLRRSRRSNRAEMREDTHGHVSQI